MINEITIVIPTYNEEKNIYETLNACRDFKKIILVDSYSTDDTEKIADKFKNVSITKYKFDNYVNKINFCISLVNSNYTLILDADYVLSKEIVDEIKSFEEFEKYDGFKFNIYFKILNKPITIDIYPSKTLLFKTGLEKYTSEGHREVSKLSGNLYKFKSPIYHEDKKEFKIWLKNQFNISDLESDFIINKKNLDLKSIIRKIPFIPILASPIYLILKFKILKFGISGIIFLIQRLIYEIILNINVQKKLLSNMIKALKSR
tara:strand:+ start:18116 stop:18898 length:783 start_codon:yes stop_codon:yes gene_type:complete